MLQDFLSVVSTLEASGCFLRSDLQDIFRGGEGPIREFPRFSSSLSANEEK